MPGTDLSYRRRSYVTDANGGEVERGFAMVMPLRNGFAKAGGIDEAARAQEGRFQEAAEAEAAMAEADGESGDESDGGAEAARGGARAAGRVAAGGSFTLPLSQLSVERVAEEAGGSCSEGEGCAGSSSATPSAPDSPTAAPSAAPAKGGSFTRRGRVSPRAQEARSGTKAGVKLIKATADELELQVPNDRYVMMPHKAEAFVRLIWCGRRPPARHLHCASTLPTEACTRS